VDEETDTISMEDFAKSLMVCLPVNSATKYLKRIYQLKIDGRVSFKEFMAFQLFIDDVEQIKEKVMVFRFITVQQLKQLAKDFSETNEYCKKNNV
jgi:hypothetical protein